ncbi:MAG: hypothetical protein J6T09_00015, partial [Bacteroidales bacterium]|nr:hypothetical protein [Bacteroidales bacterium]
RADRIVRLTAGSGRLGDHFLNSDGTKLLFMQRLEKGYDLCQLDIKSHSIKVLQKSVNGSFYPSRDGKSLFLVGPLAARKIDPSTG